MPDPIESSRERRPGLLRRIFGGIWGAVTWVRVALANIVFIVFALLIFGALSMGWRGSISRRFRSSRTASGRTSALGEMRGATASKTGRVTTTRTVCSPPPRSPEGRADSALRRRL